MRYQLNDQFSFGAAANYSSEVYVGQPDSTANDELGVPDYTVFDVFANYTFSEKLTARLNVANITDENYYRIAFITHSSIRLIVHFDSHQKDSS